MNAFLHRNMKMIAFGLVLVGAIIVLKSCEKDIGIPLPDKPVGPTTPYELEVPDHFPPVVVPSDNPMTVEGVQLGRYLFYDPILSPDGFISCSSCHPQEAAFSGGVGAVEINGDFYTRGVMSLVNLAWVQDFAWEGRVLGLEKKVEGSILETIGADAGEVVTKLQNDTMYVRMFSEAFPQEEIDMDNTSKALAQFIRTLVSGNSPYDQWVQKPGSVDSTGAINLPAMSAEFGVSVQVGFATFTTAGKGCAHCHGTILFTDNAVHNNGLFDAMHDDKGLGAITGDIYDDLRFRTPTLRNVMVSAPYLHDASSNNINDVLARYSNQMFDQTLSFDPVFVNHFVQTAGGLDLDFASEQVPLKDFMNILVDSTFLTNPAHSSPFQ